MKSNDNARVSGASALHIFVVKEAKDFTTAMRCGVGIILSRHQKMDDAILVFASIDSNNKSINKTQ